MLDQKHANTVGQAANELANPLTLGHRQTGQRLVEQKDARGTAQGQTHVHQALTAIGQILGQGRLHAVHAQKADQLTGLRFGTGQVFGTAPDGKARCVAGHDRQAQVVLHTQAFEQVGDLERPAQARLAGGSRVFTRQN